MVLAFIERPINVYRKEDGGLQVETQWGCRLIYELNYNNSVSARIRDYDGNVYKLNTYPSALNITERKIINHINKFLLVEHNSNKTSQPRLLDKLKFGYFTSIRQKSIPELLKMVLVQAPIIKQIVKAIGNEK